MTAMDSYFSLVIIICFGMYFISSSVTLGGTENSVIQ